MNKIKMITAIIGVILLYQQPLQAEADAPDVTGTRTALGKWVEIRQIISQERRDWELGREILKDRIGIIQDEIDSLHKKISEAEVSITEADRKRVGLVDESETLKAASDMLKEIVIGLESDTKDLIQRLPDSISARVKPLSQRLPENPFDTKLSLSERFQNVIGILNEVNKFNREVTVTSEVRRLSDGISVEVATLYVGTAWACYVNGKGDIAGTGRATASGWIWEENNAAAGSIAEAIAILKNEKVATFVRLPVEIH